MTIPIQPDLPEAVDTALRIIICLMPPLLLRKQIWRFAWWIVDTYWPEEEP